MSHLTLVPAPAEADTEDEWVHLVCPCNWDVALCGEDDLDGWNMNGTEESNDVCPLCHLVWTTAQHSCKKRSTP